MPTTNVFRLATYLTLAAACACLGYAEAGLFPEVGFFAVAVIVCLAVIYHLETRIELLSIPAANKLGVVIAVASAGWVTYRIVREVRQHEYAQMGWQLLLVALFGPVLMMLMPAKLLRREKHVGDYWGLHAAGLAAVGLAGAIAEDPACFVLMGLYAVCAVWGFTLFFLARVTGDVPPIPRKDLSPDDEQPTLASPVVARPGRGRTELSRVLLWTAAAAGVAVPFYLLTPRSAAGKLDFGKQRIEVGYAADQMVDLNRTGNLNTNRDRAFEVEATRDDGSPKDDLPSDVRWRGTTLAKYANGTWARGDDYRLPDNRHTIQPPAPWVPPNLGPGRFRLTFTVPNKLRSFFLLDPVTAVPGDSYPVVTPGLNEYHAWYPSARDGSFLPVMVPPARANTVTYIQYSCPQPDTTTGPAFEMLAGVDLADFARPILNNPVPRVKEYADQLLARLIQNGTLPPEARPGASARTQVSLLPPEEHHEAIARAFAKHLALTPDLAYSTKLRRDRKDVDPIEDFLYHSKVGHCERFATALVLMLRSQGIPAVMVLGFHGCDSDGDGKYVVRHEHAHAWAEALVSRPTPPGWQTTAARPPQRVWHWLSLDPTPAGGDEAGGGANGRWWNRATAWGRTAFNKYVTDYTADQRQKAIDAATGGLRNPVLWGALGAAVVAGAGVWVVRRRKQQTTIAVADTTRWFDQLLAVLAPHGFAPAPGETPREFATTVCQELRTRTTTAAVAGLPEAWAEAYYLTRFGGVELPDEERTELERQLDALREALAA